MFDFMSTSYNTIDSAVVTKGRLDIPMVFEQQGEKVIGFIPGFIMNYIVSDTLEECEEKVYDYLKEKVTDMNAKNEPFPFFPTNEEIVEDFKPIKVRRVVTHLKKYED